MSERFTLDVRMDMPKLLIDKNTNEKYNLLMVNDIERIVDLLNEQQSTINNQEQKIKILQQEIKDTQAILEMLTEKLKGWNDE